MEYVKTLVISVLAAVLNYLDPLLGNMQSLVALFLLNFVVGLVAGILKENERFSLHKMLVCFIWAAAICVIICAVYYIGEKNGSPKESLECVRYVVLVAIWAFGTNILRNLCRLAEGYEPAYKLFSLFYEVMSVEILKRIPIINAYISNNGNKNEGEQRTHRKDEGI